MKKKYNPQNLIVTLLTIASLLVLLYFFVSFTETVSVKRQPNGGSTKSQVSKFKYFVLDFLSPLWNDDIKEKLKDKKIEVIELEADHYNWSQLNSSLPKTGKEYIPISIKRDNKWEDAELKYRGDTLYQWAYEKKSYTIRLQNNQKIDLSNPKSSDFIADKVAAGFATQYFNLYVPRQNWVGLFINKKFKGIFLQVEDVNDSFAKNNTLETIYEGDKISFGDTSGSSLFIDYSKWVTSAGNINEESLIDYLEKINKNNIGELLDSFNLDYISNFYAWVSFIENIHYDGSHNWKLGLKNNQLYPIAWDPVSWIQTPRSGNKVEEINSPLSRLLRKNIFFNQAFAEKMWSIVNNKDLNSDIDKLIDHEINFLKDVLDYDIYKGSSHQNKNGMRYPQTTSEIIGRSNDLKKSIRDRLEFIKENLLQVKADYFLDLPNNYLYLNYTGIAGSYLSQGKSESIEVFNENNYINFPQVSSQNKILLVGGRIPPRVGVTYYAQNCPMTYRIKVDSNFEISQIKLVHSLSGEEIKLTKSTRIGLSDCQMNFNAPQQSLVVTKTSNSKNLPIVEVTSENVHIADFFDFNNKVGKNVNKNKVGEIVKFKLNNQEIKGEFKKSKYDDIIRLKLETLYQGREKWIFLEANDGNQKYIKTTSVAKQLGLASPLFQQVYLTVNGFNIGEYYLIENVDKGFIENNKMTFDTDIFVKNEADTLKIDNWNKVAFDPHESENNTKLLEEFLKDVKDIKNLDQWIEIESFIDFYNFIALTGNENLDYLLYFDNTQGRFKFIPYYYILYKNNKFEVKDPVIKNVVKYLEEKGYLTYSGLSQFNNISEVQSNISYDKFAILNISKMENLVFPEDYELGIFKDKLNNNKIVLEENSHYEINYDIVIPSNIDLVINPGVNLKIAEGKSIVTYGQVFASGREDNPIYIKTKSDKSYGVFAVVGNQADGSEFEYVNFENGSETFFRNIYLSAEFTVYHTEAKISHCYVNGSSSDDGLNIKFAKADLSYTTFDSNSGDAFDGDFVTGDVYNNYFINNGNDGADVSGSQVNIYNNHIQNSGDKCISVGENSSPLITNNFLDGCHTGIEIKDHSDVKANNNVFINNGTGINAYQKKDFFAGGYGKITNSIFYNNNKNLTYNNVFTGEKLASDDSKIVIIDSVVDKLDRDESLLQQGNRVGIDTLQSIKNNNWNINNIGLTDNGFLKNE